VTSNTVSANALPNARDWKLLRKGESETAAKATYIVLVSGRER